MRLIEDYGPAPLDHPAAYPGQWPAGPVRLVGDRVVVVPADVDTAGRRPLVAIGSNACPAQLRRKGVEGDVLLTPTILRNHLIVYAGHVTAYGAVPATVERWPSARCAVFVAWLTAGQAERVEVSENGNYQLVDLPTSAGPLPSYRAVSGTLRSSQGTPIRLASVMADGDGLPPAMRQEEALAVRRARSA